ncbi:hypothetical protein COX47_00410 [Candidatus Roizmanbacteria bacterium CG23_combo_of_CG06-09_8_20_14_all_35_49]|uniref:Restriction endonuclease n=1 Tax=Candidatus Roizmanbacteria bacterium CG23_combo_of_CG06-09_8_20_14_all_35_49 TaxID=1974863 RepID=A0A2G9Y7S1_9BACT|nr:MAG: hypothetical protein COX47_00410 [Candidatus Roizmanbacteria bacterium CG23_combo_of_CG06-09_8_20_14_all_35_49]
MDDIKFEEFLSFINLGRYRDKYRPIKLVEMDLPKEIQAIELLYQVYWNERKLLDFDDFYNKYLNTYKSEIEIFRKKITMCEDCFYRGLPARIYRTWASIITQIHAGYVAEAVFGKDTVKMSVKLDHQGADFQVTYKNTVLNYQVKKNSFSREVRKRKEVKNIIKGIFLDILYEVPSGEYFSNPKKLDGSFKTPYLRFINNRNLKRLPNGFVVFTRQTFKTIKEEFDNKLK